MIDRIIRLPAFKMRVATLFDHVVDTGRQSREIQTGLSPDTDRQFVEGRVARQIFDVIVNPAKTAPAMGSD